MYVCMLVDEVTMASIILVEHLRQKMQSSFGGDDERSRWHLFHEPIETKSTVKKGLIMDTAKR